MSGDARLVVGVLDEQARVGLVEGDFRVLLEGAHRWAREAGARSAVGPMDLSSWHSYRARVEDGCGRFFLEPRDDGDVGAAFLDAGFRVALEHRTLLLPHTTCALVERAMNRTRVRPMGAGDLDSIYDLVRARFRSRPGFVSATRATFHRLYRGAELLLDAGLSFIAHDASGPLGFLFGYPDLRATGRTVIKSVAVREGADFVGWALVGAHQRAARELGAEEGVFALMQKGRALERYAERVLGEATRVSTHALYRFDY